MTTNSSIWTTFFNAQRDLRKRYEQKARAVQQQYADLDRDEPTVDPLLLLARQGSLYGELDALQYERETKLAEMETPG